MKMYKYFVAIICTFCLFFPNCHAAEKVKVTFSSCVDGDTAKFKLDDEEITARFLAIDTPETKHPTQGEEPWGKEASEFTCDSLENAQKIELEYDDGSDKIDKYDRHLVWVWIDDTLLQDSIIKKGYAEVAYLYGDYKYTSLLQDHQALAEAEKIGIWGENPVEEKEIIDYWYIALLIIAIIVIYFFGSKKTKNKIKKKVKSKLKKEIQSRL